MDRNSLVYLVVASLCGAVALACSLGVWHLAAQGREIPPALVGIGSAALGHLMGLVGGLKPPAMPPERPSS